MPSSTVNPPLPPPLARLLTETVQRRRVGEGGVRLSSRFPPTGLDRSNLRKSRCCVSYCARFLRFQEEELDLVWMHAPAPPSRPTVLLKASRRYGSGDNPPAVDAIRQLQLRFPAVRVVRRRHEGQSLYCYPPHVFVRARTPRNESEWRHPSGPVLHTTQTRYDTFHPKTRCSGRGGGVPTHPAPCASMANSRVVPRHY